MDFRGNGELFRTNCLSNNVSAGVRVTFQESADGRIIRLRLADGETTSEIIGAAFEVHSTLGYGLLEKVYQHAMQVELIKRGRAEMETAIMIRVPSVPIRNDAEVGSAMTAHFRNFCASADRWRPLKSRQILLTAAA